MPALAENRKFIRYMLPYGILYVFDHYSTRVGWVKDIGMGGLLCEFIHRGNTDKIRIIDIFAYDPENIYIPSVVCENAFTLAVGERHSFGKNLFRTRYGQQFVSLTAEQKTIWQNFIEKICKYSDSFITVYDPFR